VLEWVNDWKGDYYSTSPDSNPPGPATGTYKVTRGGSWNLYSIDLRVAYRGGNTPSSNHWTLGFRCAASAPGE
jgi:iron(II)-dependent oxidoreductase